MNPRQHILLALVLIALVSAGCRKSSSSNEQTAANSTNGEERQHPDSGALPLVETKFFSGAIGNTLGLQMSWMTAVFAHPATSGIIIWGFWEKRHWIPNAAQWTGAWQLRGHGKVWYDLVFKKWWTHVNTATGRNGVAKVRGFLGEYTIEVRAGSKTKTVRAKLTKGGTRVEIEL